MEINLSEGIIAGLIILIIILLIILIPVFIYYKYNKRGESTGLHTFKPKEIDSKKTQNKNINLQESQLAIKLLNDLINDIFEFYSYKEILPIYYGSKKTSPFTKEEVKDLKDKFTNQVLLTINPQFLKAIQSIYTKEGLLLYIHSKFMTKFNKIDAKFNLDPKLKNENFGLAKNEKNFFIE